MKKIKNSYLSHLFLFFNKNTGKEWPEAGFLDGGFYETDHGWHFLRMMGF